MPAFNFRHACDTTGQIYNLRTFREFYCANKKTIRCSTEIDTYKATQFWELLPYDLKISPTLIEFKDCPCRLRISKTLVIVDLRDIRSFSSPTYKHWNLWEPLDALTRT